MSIYIYASGPIELTLEDFWRMVWQQRSSKIVMLTNLEEQKKVGWLSGTLSEVVKTLDPTPKIQISIFKLKM